eukprot:CAMPEP_0169297660 /NCGR_PEP_ID=MMETSP1016-20121227/65891_1 /TAXON_ID=342587 /ORGANISM="Karlodinium micrum, Strain CCMP2283" /LENGTH=110 /DNA_ID=CAMNT_0009389331 /DNA_START=142 /DNA_END=476 /DNA_ORIENTATION=+
MAMEGDGDGGAGGEGVGDGGTGDGGGRVESQCNEFVKEFPFEPAFALEKASLGSAASMQVTPQYSPELVQGTLATKNQTSNNWDRCHKLLCMVGTAWQPNLPSSSSPSLV